MDVDELTSNFEFFDDWEDRYRFIIDLGRDLPPLPDSDKNDANLIRGCQSQVWMTCEQDSQTGHLHLHIDSDAHIVRGLISIVLIAYDDRKPAEILEVRIEDLFTKLDLIRHLSPTRGNGLRAMVGRIRENAAALA